MTYAAFSYHEGSDQSGVCFSERSRYLVRLTIHEEIRYQLWIQASAYASQARKSVTITCGMYMHHAPSRTIELPDRPGRSSCMRLYHR